MSRLIDADALKATMIETLEQIKANPKMNGQEMHIIAGIAMLGEMIDASPTIDAVPVVRGKWVMSDMQEGWVTCSVCKKMKFDGRMAFSPTLFVEWGLNFCPHCGADMRQTGDENV